MNRDVLSGLLEQVISIVREAGELLHDQMLSGKIREKGKTDFVTAVDTAVQAHIRERLEELDDSIQFMGEEQDNTSLVPGRLTWILDPVDGTTNLIHGFRHSAISLALAEGEQVLLGIIYDPFAEELFTAQIGQGAFCNHRPIHVSSVQTLSDSLCSVGTNPGCREQADTAFRLMRAVYDHCHDIRRIGAASIELCYVACGRLDGYLEHGLRPWDFAAGKLILQEAGGKLTDYRGAEPFLSRDRSDIMASNGQIHDALQSLLERSTHVLFTTADAGEADCSGTDNS